jgi:hypothetical protein
MALGQLVCEEESGSRRKDLYTTLKKSRRNFGAIHDELIPPNSSSDYAVVKIIIFLVPAREAKAYKRIRSV